MDLKNREEFDQFLADALMYDEGPLQWSEPFPELIFDSTGKLMLAAALENELGISVSLDDLINCNTPEEVHALALKNS